MFLHTEIKNEINLKRKNKGVICKQQYKHLCFERCLHAVAAQTRIYRQSSMQLLGTNRKATAPPLKQAELTALPAVQNKEKLNQHVSKLNISEKCLCFPTVVR